MPGSQRARKEGEQSSSLASKILEETKLLMQGSNTRASKKKKLPRSVLILLEKSTVKYYREIKTQYNDFIDWELMSWSLIDKEESEGGEIFKKHDCPQLELKLSSFLWDFHSSERHEPHRRDGCQRTQMHMYWCVGAWGRLDRALPKNLASFANASHSSRQQWKLYCLVFLSFSHTEISKHFMGQGTVVVSPSEKDCNKQLTYKITQQFREAENHSHRRPSAKTATCFARLPLFWQKKKGKDEASQLVKKAQRWMGTNAKYQQPCRLREE